MQATLDDVTAIDLAERALITGHMLAQLGATVTQIEPPGGLAVRREAPWTWAAYGAGKRSATVDLASVAGRASLRQAIAGADMLIESERPGALAEIGLGISDLQAVNPRLIHVSVTPFGSTGPKAQWNETDLILWASGGPLYPSRDGERPPLRISVPQAWLHGGADAAGAALVALHARAASGLGQHVDISVQQSVTQATLAAILAEGLGHHGFNYGLPQPKDGPPIERSLDLSGSGARTRRSKWRVRDGLMEMHLGLGAASGAKTNNLFAWMAEEGALPDRFRDWDWIKLPARFASGELSEVDLERARSAVAAFLAGKSKAEIVPQAIGRGILMAPIYQVSDLVGSPHHAARQFFEPAGPAGELMPGAFAAGIPFVPLRPAPPVGPPLAGSAAAPARTQMKPATVASAGRSPFADLKVLDLAWVVAGPAIGRVLADYGATVVRVESSKRLDASRLMGPFPGGRPDGDRSACFEAYNTGKLGVTLDLAQPAARDVVRDLIGWADVLVESFAPGQMARWQLGYDDLKQVKPDLVMVSTSLMGQSGPYARVAGFGNVGAAMAGFQPLVGWPDALPIGPFGPYTDYVGPRFALTALLAALHRRRATGEGTWLDVSQAEAGIQFLAPEILEYGATGKAAAAHGNRDRSMAPHGVFPGYGFDRWIAVAVRGDEEWERLADMIGGEALDPRYRTLAGRREHEDALELHIALWTKDFSVEATEERLQAAGIAAHVVASGADLLLDPQLQARDHFLRLPRPDGSECLVESSRFRLSGTPAAYPRTAPTMGRDTMAVLTGILNYDTSRLAALESAGVLV